MVDSPQRHRLISISYDSSINMISPPALRKSMYFFVFFYQELWGEVRIVEPAFCGVCVTFYFIKVVFDVFLGHD